MITLRGEVTSIGHSPIEKNSQRIEVSLTDAHSEEYQRKIQYSTLYLTFKGESPYVLDDQLVITIGTPREMPEPTNLETKENTNA